MTLEALERRRLMSVSFDVPNKAITIVGEEDFDEITAKVEAGVLKISDNGAAFDVTAAAVKKLFIFTGDGDDTVTLEPSVTQDATVYTGVVNFGSGDHIQTAGGKDTIYVESVFSSVNAGENSDYIYNLASGYLGGGNGDDHLINVSGSTTETTYDGQGGYDIIDYTASTGNLVLRNGEVGFYIAGTGVPLGAPPTIDGSQLTDSVGGMEGFYSGSGNDWVYGTNGSNLIRSGKGNDKVFGGGGDDFLYAGAGLDATYGEGGNDRMFDKDGSKDYFNGGTGFDGAQRDAIDIVNSVEYSIA